MDRNELIEALEHDDSTNDDADTIASPGISEAMRQRAASVKVSRRVDGLEYGH